MSATSPNGDAYAFDASAPATEGRIWGLPFDVDQAALVLVPVPWEATVSYGTGAASAPSAILKASAQVDLYDSKRPDAWKRGIAMSPIPEALRAESDRARSFVSASTDDRAIDEVNDACEHMVDHVRKETAAFLKSGKLVATVGGDHSTPLGLLQNLGERYADFGVLHIDAHCDLRKAYEGFEHSHASIMYNALQNRAVQKLVQIGIRDYCDEEHERIVSSNGRIRLFEHRDVLRRRFAGDTWRTIREEILSELPQQVYVSFDVDGLDPSLCPGTGTPVPGGLSYEEALYLIDGITESGRTIIGFDLSEVATSPTHGEWDANVGARLLYRLSCATLEPEETRT